MAKKSSSKNALKSLFSRSEASLDETQEQDAGKAEGEKKKFKFPKFRTKSKKVSSGEKEAAGGPQVLSAVETSNAAEDGADTIRSKPKRPYLYATAPRSKSKEFSYSELDLRKPKRFATFSFGLKRRKKKDEENISKSTFGLYDAGTQEKEETPLDLRQMTELAQADMKTTFSMSQPELDTGYKFDIPSPPPVATNKSELPFTYPKQSQSSVPVNAGPDLQERLANRSTLFDVHKEPPKAPIASIPELQLDDEDLNVIIPEESSARVARSPVPVAHTETSSADIQPSLPASQPPTVVDASGHEEAHIGSICSASSAHDNEILSEPCAKTKTCLNGSSSAEVSNVQPAAPDSAEGITQSGGSKTYATITECDKDVTLEADSSTVHQEISGSGVPEPARSISTMSAVNGDKILSVNNDVIYGQFYESLFPQGFTSKVNSSISNPPQEVYSETGRFYTKSEPVMVKTTNESHTETGTYSHLSTSGEFISHKRDEDGSRSTFASHLSPLASSLSPLSEPVCPVDIHYSELSHSHSRVKSDSFSRIQDTFTSVPEVHHPATPVSHYVTSQGAEAQVTDSKQRAILVKETVTEGTSTDPGCPSAALHKVSTMEGPEIKIKSPGQMDGYEGLLNPAYLSVGSDDGSAIEIYYSAEEGSSQESGDEDVYTMDEREEKCVVDGVKEMDNERGGSLERQTDKQYQGFFVKMQIGEGFMGKEEEAESFSCQTEVQRQLGGQRAEVEVCKTKMSEFPVSKDGQSQQKAVAEPQMKAAEEGIKEEFLATPVEQVDTLMVCEAVPASIEPHGQGEGSEGNWSQNLVTEVRLNGEKKIPSQELQYLSYKDPGGSEYLQAASGRSGGGKVITPTLGPSKEEQVSKTAHRFGEADRKNTEARIHSATNVVRVPSGSLPNGAELQADAAESDLSRALRRGEWAETISQSINRNGTAKDQAAVELPALNTDAHWADSEVVSEGPEHPREHPPGAQPDLDQGSLAAEPASEGPQTEPADNMNKGYSSLSTTLSIKTPSLPREEESKHRVHKVSLINEAEASGASLDAVDFARTSTTFSNGTDVNPENKWKNKFDGVSQYKPSKVEDSSHSSSSSTSSLLSLSGTTVHENPSKTFSSSSSTSFSSENVYLSREFEPAERRDGWRRSSREQEESSAPAGKREGEAESQRTKSHWDSQQLPVSASGFTSGLQTRHADISEEGNDDDDDVSLPFTGVYRATFVELVPDPPASPATPPDSPDASSQFDMENLVDTLKSMGPPQMPRAAVPRAAPPALMSSLPPIVEDAPVVVSADVTDSSISPAKPESPSAPAEPPTARFTLPTDLGLKRTAVRDSRSPLELMKQNLQDQQLSGSRGLTLPLRPSSSILMRKPSDDELKSPVPNGNGALPSSNKSSRLDNSIIFRSYRSSSIDVMQENGKPHRPLLHTNSLPEVGPGSDRMSVAPKDFGDLGVGTDSTGPRFDRFSFLMNSSSSASGSLAGAEDQNARMSRPSSLSISSPPPSNTPTRLLSPTGSLDLHRPFSSPDSPLSMFSQTPGIGLGLGMGMGMGVGAVTAGPPMLQRSFSSEHIAGVQQTSLFNSVHGGSQFQSQKEEPDRNLLLKYRAFPDAYLTKEKEHGKLNPRPGKMYIFDQPGMCGQRIEVRSDVIDATPWELQETISIRVVRGGWVLYEKPNFKGEKIALDEGDIELSNPFQPPEEQVENGQRDGGEQNGEAKEEQTERKPARRFVIGSLRRAVRDYSVPDISLFPEENAEGKKVIFRDTSEDARIFGFPVKANSIIINAGLWLVFAQPFFQGVPRILEVGGYTNPAAWGVEQPYVGSLHPLKIGEPRVENMGEPKIEIYEKSYFTGKSRTITANMRDFMTRTDRQQNVFMYNVGSLKVLGGIWVGYEKEGFRGHQYLLEEGEYHDWRVWGGHNAELRSVRVIKADLTDPLMVMIEQPEEELEMQEEKTFEVTEATPDVEPLGYKTSTRSIHVISGAWVAYSHVDFSGDQYILEKGFYSISADWGSQDNRICSVQPILLAPRENPASRTEILLYPEPDFRGSCHVFDKNQAAVPEKLLTKSCRVVGGSWVLYENADYSGNMYVLSQGDYPSLTSMGCPPGCDIRSVKIVPMTLSVPSISLFGLECLEGREISTDMEVMSLVEEGYNNHVLSVKVHSGCWVICEYSNYRGRQFLLEPIEITNWPKFSSLHTIGSMYPVRQKRQFFRIKNKERGHFMSVQGGVEEMKSGRIVVTPEVEPMADIWFYYDGLIKNKLSPNMCLQAMGNVEPGSKVVLWSENRQPIQTWTAQMSGLITSITFPGLVLDVKGGKTYDKDHVVIMQENEERPSQQWDIELL